MQKVTFTNAIGESLTLSRTFPYLLQNLDGLGSPPITQLTQKGFQQDGVTHFGNLLESRLINFRAVIKDSDRSALIEKRKEIMRVFNPKLGNGVLIYENDDVKYRIECLVYDGPHEIIGQSERTALIQSFDVGLFCPSPAWEGNVQNSLKMVGFVGGLTFPVTLPLSLAIQGDQVEIDYSGTLDAPLLIEFRGPAATPKITKVETGELVEVDLELLSGEKLFIDTTPGAINVFKDDGAGNLTSAFNYIDHTSIYFLLTQGTNTLSFEAASGSPEVYLYWRDQFLGV